MSKNQQAARRPRFPSQFDCYYADESAAAAETPVEVEGYYASYSVEYAKVREFERPFTPIEEAFFSAGDELSEQHAEQLPTTRFAPAPAPAAKKKPAASGRRRVATA